MCKDKQTIHYCTILSAGQWNFLLGSKCFTHRQKYLYRLMNDAVQARTTYKIKGVEIILEVGQITASDVELRNIWDVTVRRSASSLTTLTGSVYSPPNNNRTSVHTLHFLTGWYSGVS